MACFVVAGWLSVQLADLSFFSYALVLAICGVIGMVGTGSWFIAPIGLAVGQVAGIFVLATRWNTLELLVTVASTSIAVLAGLLTKALMPRRTDDARD